jgi:hypothetical protein
MKTQGFLTLLQEHSNKSLLFEYAPNILVGAHYHITEVKNISIEAVDCGGNSESWKETVIQLWESPTEIGKTTYMSAYKALGILSKVNSIKAIAPNTEVKFEYGNATFHTTHLHVNDFEIRGTNLFIKLGTTMTDCKAKDACGIPEPETNSGNCAPGSGCC